MDLTSGFPKIAQVDIFPMTHHVECGAIFEVIGPRRPTRVDLTGPGSGTDPEQRLQRQVLGPAIGVVDALVGQSEDLANDVVAALLAQSRHEGEDA